MSDTGPSDVFLSHAGYGAEKQSIVSQLAKELCDRNISVFFDKESIQPGENADVRMVSEAATAKVVVVVLSPDYVIRPWPLKELEIALARQSDDASLQEKFKGALEVALSEGERALLEHVKPTKGAIYPLFFKLDPKECGDVNELKKRDVVKKKFAAWDGSGYPQRWETALAELKKRNGPVYHEHAEEYTQYAKRVAAIIAGQWFPHKRVKNMSWWWKGLLGLLCTVVVIMCVIFCTCAIFGACAEIGIPWYECLDPADVLFTIRPAVNESLCLECGPFRGVESVALFSECRNKSSQMMYYSSLTTGISCLSIPYYCLDYSFPFEIYHFWPCHEWENQHIDYDEESMTLATSGGRFKCLYVNFTHPNETPSVSCRLEGHRVPDNVKFKLISYIWAPTDLRKS